MSPLPWWAVVLALAAGALLLVSIGAIVAEWVLPRVLRHLGVAERERWRLRRRVDALDRLLARVEAERDHAQEAFADLSATFDRTVSTAAKVAYDNGVEEGQTFEANRRQAGLS